MISTFVSLNCAAALPIWNLHPFQGLPVDSELALDLSDHQIPPASPAEHSQHSYEPDQLHAERQPHAHLPSTKDELRSLQWGEINFLHTTDTHGWLAGHILESEFSGDWGDFVSFTERMRQLANEKGVDLLIVDSGDRHDGNGLSDASKHDGSLSLPIFCEVDFDVVTIGNHESYRGAASLQEFHDIRKRFGERYVVSNVDVAIGRAWIPLGHKYRLFRTPNQNRQILALGFLFDFTGNDKSTTRVTPVADELEKPWFQKLLREVIPTVDHVVLVSHIPARNSPEFASILAKIREVRETVPVSMFAGHSHIRDYKVYDDYAVALQSGRYVETIGWASVGFPQNEKKPVFSRSYIDFNARTMAFHASVDSHEPSAFENDHEFSTEHGEEVSKHITKARKKSDLDHYLADVPQNWYTDRAAYPSSRSIYSLFGEKISPRLTSPEDLQNATRYIYLNTGAIRFDSFKGPYTKDTGYISSPFNNDWFYIPEVPKNIADEISSFINGEERVLLGTKSRYTQRYASEIFEEDTDVEDVSRHAIANEDITALHKPSRGYVTRDDSGADGDDTVHTAWKFHPIPNCISSVVPPQQPTANEQDEEAVALIFDSFLASFVQKALQELKREDSFEPLSHGGERPVDLIPDYLRDLQSET